MRCASFCAEEQIAHTRHVASLEFCNVGVQVDLSLRSPGPEVLHAARAIFLDLMLDLDGAPAINEVAGFKGESFRDSHARGGKQDVENTLLPIARSDEF